MRDIKLVEGEFYHVYNRGVDRRIIFPHKRDFDRFLESMKIFNTKENIGNLTRHDNKKVKERLVDFIAYCINQNHFHFIITPLIKNGIEKFMHKLCMGHSKYFNAKYQRSGTLFQGKFKAVRIETEEQLLHVSRYIHLNPCTAYVIKNIGDLENYSFSSYPEYLGKTSLQFCNKEMIFNYFKSKRLYQDFVFNQADYQRRLEEIKHLVLEK